MRIKERIPQLILNLSYKVGEAEIFTQELEKYEVGDMFKHGHSIDFAPTEIGKDVFQNGGLIILSKVKYEDSCKYRYFINKLLGKQYSISRLMFYDVSGLIYGLKNKKYLESIFFTSEGYNKTIKEYLNLWNLTKYIEDEVNI